MLSEEAINTNCIVFGLTRLGLEPTIYRTRREPANHYATDADVIKWKANYNDKDACDNDITYDLLIRKS